MAHRPCHRCQQVNRSTARFCALCGCRQIRSTQASASTPRKPSNCVVAWLLFFAFAFVLLRGDELIGRASAGTDPTTGSIGLIYDFPPDYPIGYFRTVER